MTWLIITLLAVGGALCTDVKEGVKDEKIVYKCVLYNSDKGLILKDIKFPLYTCETEEGDKILVAGKDLVDDKLDAILDKETYLKLKDPSVSLKEENVAINIPVEQPMVPIRVKRTFLPFGGIGIGGGIGYGGGFGLGGFGGYPGYGGFGPGFYGPGYGGGFGGGYGSGFGGGFIG